jgi:hypothetical protein
MIKFSNKKVIEVQDWDDLVQKTYGKVYSLQQQNGCIGRQHISITVPDEEYNEEEMHDSIPDIVNGNTMGVKFNIWLSRDPKEWNGEEEDRAYVDMFWDRNFYPDLQTVANDLHKKGLIEAGEYTINIDW